MLLHEFITNALSDIALGITNANKQIGEEPTFVLRGGNDGVIDFIVKVGTENASNTGASGKAGMDLKILSFSVSPDAHEQEKIIASNTIKFSVRPQEKAFFIASDAIVDRNK